MTDSCHKNNPSQKTAVMTDSRHESHDGCHKNHPSQKTAVMTDNRHESQPS